MGCVGAETSRVAGMAATITATTITTTKLRVSVLEVLITSYRVADKKSKLWYVTITLFSLSVIEIHHSESCSQPPNSMNGLYAEPASASRSTPALQSHRSQHGPYFTGSGPPPLPQPSRPQKRPLLQRIFHPQFGFGGGGASDPLSASRRGFRR